MCYSNREHLHVCKTGELIADLFNSSIKRFPAVHNLLQGSDRVSLAKLEIATYSIFFLGELQYRIYKFPVYVYLAQHT